MSDSVPTGYRFCPTDYELVFHYLYKKVTKNFLPCDSVVRERNLYGESEPWDIFNNIINGSYTSVENDAVQYFFTKLKKRSKTDLRIDRTTVKGTWKGQDSGRKIFDRRGRIVGFKKNFVYENNNSIKNNGRWIMHEYRLHKTLPLRHPMQAKEEEEGEGEGEDVLCRIRRKGVLQEARSEVQEGNNIDLPSTFGDLHLPIFPSSFLNREAMSSDNIPIGYRFIPTDYELIFYLYKKVSKNPLPCDNVVREKNLYDMESEPWDIFDDSDLGEEVQYFFTKLKKRSEKRIDRTIGKGTWKGQDSGKKICDDRGRRIGFRKNFVYENKKSENNGRWIMYEYRLDDNLLQWIRTQLHEKEDGEVAICRIRKKEGLRESSSEVVQQGNSMAADVSIISDEPILDDFFVASPSSVANSITTDYLRPFIYDEPNFPEFSAASQQASSPPAVSNFIADDDFSIISGEPILYQPSAASTPAVEDTMTAGELPIISDGPILDGYFVASPPSVANSITTDYLRPFIYDEPNFPEFSAASQQVVADFPILSDEPVLLEAFAASSPPAVSNIIADDDFSIISGEPILYQSSAASTPSVEDTMTADELPIISGEPILHEPSTASLPADLSIISGEPIVHEPYTALPPAALADINITTAEDLPIISDELLLSEPFGAPSLLGVADSMTVHHFLTISGEPCVFADPFAAILPSLPSRSNSDFSYDEGWINASYS